MVEVARLEGRLIIDGIRESQSALRSFDSAMESTAKRAESATGRVEKSASGLSSSLKGIGQTAAGTAAGLVGFSSAQAVLTTSIEGTIGAALGYEKALNVMQATSSATDAEMRQISETAKALGNDNTLAGVSALDAAAAMTELSRAGLSVNDTMTAAKGVLQLATAGQLDNAEAASITAAALNSFGLAGSEATRVADMLAAAANASQADVGELGQGMAQASAIFHNAGQPIETLITAMAQMSKAGIQGSDAATSLKTAMLSLMAPTKEAAGEMAKYDINVRDAQGNMLPFRAIIEEITAKLGGLSSAQQDAALKTIFGSDAIRAAQIVFTAGTETYDENAAAVGRVGAANELAAAQMKGAAGAIAAFQSSMETLGLIAGEKLLPTITTLVGGLSTVLGVITSLPGPVQAAAAAAAGLGIAFLAFQANPVIAAITAITLGVTFLAGKLSEANKEQQALNNSLMAAGASALQTYATALKNIETAGGGLAERQSFLRGQVSALAIEYSRGNQVLQEAVARYNELKGAHGESSVQAEAQKKIVTDLTQAQYNLAGSLQVARGAVADGGESLMQQAASATAAKDALNQTAQAAANAGQAAGQIDPLQQAIEEVFQSAEKTSKALRDLMNPPTGAEQQIAAQLAAIEGATQNLEAATNTAGQVRDDFIAQSRELLASANLEDDALKAAESAISRYEQGLINGEQAQKALVDALKPSIDTLSSIQEAFESTRTAISTAAEAEINAGRGWSDSMEDRKAKLQGFVDAALGRFPEVTAGAQQMSGEVSSTLDAMSANAEAQGTAVPAGVAAGIRAGTPDAVAAAADMAAQVQAQMESVLQIRSPSRKGWGVGRNYALAVGGGIDEASVEAVQAAESLATNLITPLDRMAPVMRENVAAIARLDLEIAKLNETLAYTEPHSEREAALKAEIQTLTAWRGQIQAGISLLEAEAKAIEASKTALDGATEARARFAREQGDTARFGEGGAGVMGDIITALTENTAEAGRTAVATLEGYIADLQETLGPRATEAGAYLRFLLFEALGAVTPEDREAALARMGGFFTELQAEAAAKAEEAKAAATLTASSYANAYATALASANLKEQVGPLFADLFATIDQQAKEGSAQNIARLAEMNVGIQQELTKLPEYVRGHLGAEWATAWQQFLDGTISADDLKPIAQRINQAVSFFPEELEKQIPQVRAAAQRLWEQVTSGSLTAEQAAERLAEIIRLIPEGFNDLSPQMQAEILSIIDGFNNMGLSAEAAGQRIQAAMQAASQSAALTAEQIAKLNAHLTVNQQGVTNEPLAGPAATPANLYALAHIMGPLASDQIAAAYAAGLESIGQYVTQQELAAQQMLAEMARGTKEAEAQTAELRKLNRTVAGEDNDDPHAKYRGMAAARLTGVGGRRLGSDMNQPFNAPVHMITMGGYGMGGESGGITDDQLKALGDYILAALRAEPLTAVLSGRSVDNHLNTSLRGVLR